MTNAIFERANLGRAHPEKDTAAHPSVKCSCSPVVGYLLVAEKTGVRFPTGAQAVELMGMVAQPVS